MGDGGKETLEKLAGVEGGGPSRPLSLYFTSKEKSLKG